MRMDGFDGSIRPMPVMRQRRGRGSVSIRQSISPALLLDLLLLAGSFLPLPGAFDKRRPGIVVFCLRSHPFAFPSSVEALLNAVGHAAALRFSQASIMSTTSDISQSRFVTPAAVARVTRSF